MKAVLKLYPTVIKVSMSKSIVINTVKNNKAQYRVALAAADIDWDLDWVKITPNHGMRNIRIKPWKLWVSTGYGSVLCTPIINYPFEIYQNNANYFRIKDRENLLNMANPFEYLIFEYDLESDLENRNNVDFIENFKFGNNTILEEYLGNNEHAYLGRSAFESVYPNNPNLFITTLDAGFSPKGHIENIDEGRLLNKYSADLLLHPYSLKDGTLPYKDNIYQNPEVLKVIAHGGNELKRVDITESENDFFLNTVCVGAIVDDDNFQTDGNGTTYGFGLEFYENTNTKIWDELYPEKKFKAKVFNALLSENKNSITNTSGTFSPMRYAGIEVGALIVLKNIAGQEFEARIQSIDNSKRIIYFEESIAGLSGARYDIYTFVALGSLWCPYVYSTGSCGSQSFAVNIIGAKLKMIKNGTGASWNVCRNAARKTASLSVYNPTTDTWQTNWDMWRGFGIINVDAAVGYILKNTNRREFRDSSVINLPKTAPFLEFSNYHDDNYCPIKFLRKMFDYLHKKMGIINTNILDTYYFETYPDVRVKKTGMLYEYAPVYEVIGNGGFQSIIVRHSTAAEEGEKLTLSCYMRIVTDDVQVNNMPALRMTHGMLGDEKSYNSKVNIWEKVIIHYEAKVNEQNQIQINPAYNVNSKTQFCALKLEPGWVENPIYIPKVDDVFA